MYESRVLIGTFAVGKQAEYLFAHKNILVHKYASCL